MKRLLTSFLGLGWLPIAPGTWGSLPVAMVFAVLAMIGAGGGISFSVQVFFVLAGSFICIRFSDAAVAATGSKDPGEVVVDEVAGQAVTFLPACFFIGNLSSKQAFIAAVLGFLIFRVFDIVKLWPCKKLEYLKDGWGILADDLMAGIYAGIILLLSLKLGMVEKLAGYTSFNGQLNVFAALILGAIQGLTEFLPVSSSGHLVLLEKLITGINPDSRQMLLFDLAIHVGTVVAIFIVFKRSIIGLIKNFFGSASYGKNPLTIYKKSPSVHILVLAMFATVVTGIIGILFENSFEQARGSLGFVCVMWLITATLLLITDFRKRTRIGLRQFGILAALIIGLAQSVAIIPGISRSGATICAAILLGLRRRWAVEFSFLLAIPAILGAMLITIVKDISDMNGQAIPVLAFLAGMITACVVGVIALKILIRVSKKSNLKIFAIYCYLLAFFVWVFLL